MAEDGGGDVATVGKLVGQVMRDAGRVGFCRTCRRAEMPGVTACGRCGAVLEFLQKSPERRGRRAPSG